MTRAARAKWQVATLLALALLVAGCVQRGSPKAEQVAGDAGRGGGSADERPYRIAYMEVGPPKPFAEVQHLGPHFVVTSFLFDTLTWRNERGVIPWLAESWQPSEDARVWTFFLRKGVLWPDGQPLTARDAAFSLLYYRDHPRILNASLLRDVLDSAEASDDRTLVVRLRRPVPDFAETFAGTIPVLPAHVWQTIPDPGPASGPATTMGSGPFRLAEYRKGEFYVFEAKPEHFAGRPRVRQLVIRVIQNPTLALERGELDAAAMEPRAAAALDGRNGLRALPERSSYFTPKVVFNVGRSPWADIRVRQALVLATDREALVRQVEGGHGTVASVGFLHPDSPWYVPLAQPPYAPDRARSLLDAAGLTDRDGDGVREDPNGRPFRPLLICRQNPTLTRICTVLKEQWAQVGMVVEIKVVPTAVSEELLGKGEFEIAVDGHGGLVRPFIPPDFPARVYRNSEYLEAYAAFQAEMRPERRRELARRLQEILARDLPILPLYHVHERLVVREDRGITWFWTWNGIGGGVPSWWNKLALLERR